MSTTYLRRQNKSSPRTEQQNSIADNIMRRAVPLQHCCLARFVSCASSERSPSQRMRPDSA
eukprot:1030654-Amphidinium_carterae.1